MDKSLGYVKLWRCMMDERIFCNADLWRLWTWMLMKANHSDKTWCPINKGAGEMEVEVEKGQFLFGRNSAAAELKANPSTIWKRIKKLENLGFCNIQSNSNFSLITICNYNEMTESAKEKEQVKGEEREKIGNDAGEEKDTTKELKAFKESKESFKRDGKKPLKSSDKPKRSSTLPDKEWLETLKENAAYKQLDIDKVFGKLTAWCDLRNLKPTRRRLLNWLNNEDRTLDKQNNGTRARTEKSGQGLYPCDRR